MMMTALTMQLVTILIMVTPLFPKLGKYTPIPVKTAVKTAFITSLIPSTLVLKHQVQPVSVSLPISTKLMDMSLTITLNCLSALFLPIVLFVAWSIMEFATWYISPTPLTNTFTKALLIFLLAMVTLICAGNLFQLFIGWEGVGIMSFILINWWTSRTTTSSAALQAMIYNRIGDIGLILTMAILAMNYSTWNLDQAVAQQTKDMLIALGLTLAATGKSAQFFMHMWLPTAMEGPTPVSALLHSSTMVVAGIYMLAQLHPLLNTSKHLLTLCLCLGATTSLFAASCALAQNDIKKIIAFSTSSQLGLMMTAIGINSPQLAIFHMATHATFKATLFLSAGSIIHCMQNEQDIRKMGNTSTTMPITTTCLTINSLALAGMPFLSGFYSKDAILETMINSNLNSLALLMTLAATTMTSAYTLRMLIYTTTNTPRHKPSMSFHETTTSQISPILRPTLLTIILGLLLSTTFPAHPTTPLPMALKLIPVLAIIIGTTLTLDLTDKSLTPTPQKHTSYKIWNQLALYGITLHRLASLTTLKLSRTSTQLIDLIWLEKTGPKFMYSTNINISKLTSTQTGLLKNYLIIFMIFITTLFCTYHLAKNY
uniref:NADH-ubiquinone oxidoreductase chain 5 n=1 Tax=Chlamydosaurus kingii TaxID=103699 RepID=A4KVY0_CHLKI|nr:NADH dehydrogenase subunit 5 [Chlamydosaurus kingii]ABK53974.1 NADH dehydrogenase subunit 5 [Chlamydosaurus kingii]ABK53987.1 NADH dehydrogenase subunit 5 [Chlamydosaurus kingii]